MENLNKIIAQAYQLFRPYKLTQPLEVCTDCCLAEREEAALRKLALQNISANLLSEYNHAAHSAKPSINELKYFLPRFLELTAQFDFPTHSTELALSRLGYYQEEDWKAEEFELLEKYKLFFFKENLSRYPLPEYESIDAILILLHQANADIPAFLQIWKKTDSLASTLHFKDLLFEAFKKYNPTKLANPFADDKLSKLILTWVSDKDIKKLFSEKIELLIMESSELGEEDSDQLSWAYELLKAI